MSASRAPLFSSTTGSYNWTVPNRKLAIHLAPEVVERLGSEVMTAFWALPKRGIEIGGLLLGGEQRASGVRNWEVTDFAVLPCEHRFGPSYVLSDDDRAAFEARLAQRPLGYFRSHTRNGLDLDAPEREDLKRWFGAREALILLVRPFGSSPTLARLFLYSGGAIESVADEFQFRPSEPARAAARRAGPAPLPVQPEAPVPLPIPVPAPKKRSRAVWVMALLALLGAGGWYGYENWPITWPPAWLASATTPPAPHEIPLDLRLERIGSDLRLVWNPKADIVREISAARLTIADGEHRSELALDVGQVRAGNVLYSPVNADVSFYLDLLTQSGRTVSESARAVRGVPVAASPAALEERPPLTHAGTAVALAPFVAPQSRPSASRPVLEEPPALAASRLIPPPGQGRWVNELPPPPPPQPAQHAAPVQFVPPRVTRQVAPVLPDKYRKLFHKSQQWIDVQVRVRVSTSGYVNRAEIASIPAGVPAVFGELALDAARNWQFEPARRNGTPVWAETLLSFRFIHSRH